MLCWGGYFGTEHVSGAERGASEERSVQNIVGARSGFIQRLERSLCLAPVPLRYRSHHEPRACTNPPWIHLCLQQLTKPSAYTSKIIRCEGEMEFVKYFQKQTDRSYRCTIPVKKIDDNVEHDQECGDIYVLFWLMLLLLWVLYRI